MGDKATMSKDLKAAVVHPSLLDLGDTTRSLVLCGFYSKSMHWSDRRISRGPSLRQSNSRILRCRYIQKPPGPDGVEVFTKSVERLWHGIAIQGHKRVKLEEEASRRIRWRDFWTLLVVIVTVVANVRLLL